jgi:regulator of RNase E activity RraA
MTEWRSDDEMFDVMKKELFTAVVGDVMDKAGLQHQFLPPSIKPLHPSMVVLGRAMPALTADVFEERAVSSQNSLMAVPFGLMIQALDSLQRNEVYVCTGASPNYALWGGLMSTRARQLGATGAVLNGYSRDTAEILRLGFPTCSLGGYAQDQGPRGR